MAELQNFECEHCGAPIPVVQNDIGIIRCEYCGRNFIIPKMDSNSEVLQSLYTGKHCLDTCHFDDAYTAFEKASQLNDKEPEAYWGMALAEFKVQYIKDVVNNCLQPICHEISDKQFQANKNYLKAFKCATFEQQTEYEQRAKDIDYIREEFLALQQSGLDYDCFICVKVSQTEAEQVDIAKKNWTNDAYIADKIYDLLKRKGYTPFFSEREIKGRSGANYEAMILYALYTSETMLVVCSDEDYLRTPWVKNEYTRFKSLMKNKEKENDSLTIVYNGKPIDRLPIENNGRIQGIDYSSAESTVEILDFVDNHTPIARAKKEAEKKRKEAQNEEIRRQLEEQKRVQKELEEKMKNFNVNSVGAQATIGTLLTRANQEMETRNFDKAKIYFEKVLECNPENSDAWLGMILVDYRILSYDALIKSIDNAYINKNYEYLFSVSQNRNFVMCRKYAQGEVADKLNKISSTCENKIKELLKKENIDLNANSFYRSVVEHSPSNVNAMYALFLTDVGCINKNELLNKINNCNNFANYDILFELPKSPEFTKLMILADSNLKSELNEYKIACNNKLEQLLSPNNVNSNALQFYKNAIQAMPDNAKAKYCLLLLDFGCKTDAQMFDKIIEDEKLIAKFSNNQYVIWLRNCSDQSIKKRIQEIERAFNIQLKENKKLNEIVDLQESCKRYDLKIPYLIKSSVIFIFSLIALICTISCIKLAFAEGSFSMSGEQALLIMATLVCVIVVIVMQCLKTRVWKRLWFILLLPIGVVYAVYVAVINLIPLIKGIINCIKNIAKIIPLKKKIKDLKYQAYQCIYDIQCVRSWLDSKL